MAIVNNGTVNGLPEERLPVGYTRPTVTTVPDYHYAYDTVIGLLWSTAVTNSAPYINMANIVSLTTSAVTAILSADFLSTANVTAYAVINGLDNNNNVSNPNVLSSNVSQGLNVSVTIYVKSV